jgi:hypothetical protein
MISALTMAAAAATVGWALERSKRGHHDCEEVRMTGLTLDMTMMFATHDALRRDLAQVTQLNARNEGWSIFEQMLHAHHMAEDDLRGR